MCIAECLYDVHTCDESLWSDCTLWEQQMREMKEVKEKEKVDQQKEMEAVSVTQASTRQQVPDHSLITCSVFTSHTHFVFIVGLCISTITQAHSTDWALIENTLCLFMHWKQFWKNKHCVLQKFIVGWEHHQIYFASLSISLWEIKV